MIAGEKKNYAGVQRVEDHSFCDLLFKKYQDQMILMAFGCGWRDSY